MYNGIVVCTIYEYENTPTEKANNDLTCTVPSKYSHRLKDRGRSIKSPLKGNNNTFMHTYLGLESGPSSLN